MELREPNAKTYSQRADREENFDEQTISDRGVRGPAMRPDENAGTSSAPIDVPDDRAPKSPPGGEASAGELFVQLSEQTSRLIRDELKLAQTELRQTAKRAGRGGGLLGGAGVIALYGLGALIATAIIALSLVLELWAAALIVTVALFIIAGIAALLGKSQLQKAFPTPQRTMQNLKRDVQEVKESSKHDHA